MEQNGGWSKMVGIGGVYNRMFHNNRNKNGGRPRYCYCEAMRLSGIAAGDNKINCNTDREKKGGLTSSVESKIKARAFPGPPTTQQLMRDCQRLVVDQRQLVVN